MINDIVIKNPTGLHARPAAQLVELSRKFKSDISLRSGERECDAKSIFTVLRCCFKIGETITLDVSGEDEKEAMGQIVSFIENLEE